MRFATWLFILGLALNAFFVYTFTNYDMVSIGFVTAIDNPISHEVKITSKGYKPADISIRQGDNVTWSSENPMATVIFSNNVEDRFTSREIYKGEKYSHQYNMPGNYPYYDVNFGYKGTVTVLAAEPKTEPAPPGEEPIPVVCNVQCLPGCTQNADRCGCTCPCKANKDCDDSNPNTKDYCSESPVECRHEEAAISTSDSAPAEKKPEPEESNNAFLVAAILIVLGAFLYITKVFISDNNNKPRKKKRRY